MKLHEVWKLIMVNQTYMLGMVVPDITNPFFPQIIRGAEDKALERRYLLVTATLTNRSSESEVLCQPSVPAASWIAAGVCAGWRRGHLRRMVEAGISVVCLDRAPVGVKVDAVLLDNVRGGEECTRHLVPVGYRNIAIITGPLELQTARERLRGYENALREADLKYLKSWFWKGISARSLVIAWQRTCLFGVSAVRDIRLQSYCRIILQRYGN
jgi:LacI family transcriptional regulator